jgi:SAM-dependent methyltransferase
MAMNYGGYEDNPFVAEYYDITYQERRPQDVAFFVAYAREAGGPTLELGCGTGRVLIPTAAAGCQITGLDISSYMLARCRENLAAEPEEIQKRVNLVQGSMTDFSTGERYALITIPFRPFQHLVTVAEQRACLACIRQHLAPGGRCIIDVFNPRFDMLTPNPTIMQEREDLPEMELPDGRKVRRAGRLAGFHREQQYNDIELIYYITYPDGQTERMVQAFPMRYYFRYEMEHLFELSGMRVVELFGDFDKSAYSGDSPEMIFVAERKERHGQP